ncbi:MAG TPA: hypothetical protein VNH83_04650 [Bryobacteraceae bacterium]|nr:hypothetical protein [Bryobacteraceae bacterium]
MGQRKAARTPPDIKRLTGADVEATRAFLRKRCFVEGKGFSSQYADQGRVSCTTTAICVYALSETGPLTQPDKNEFQRILLAFRRDHPADQAGAFPRTTGETPSAWTTGQAALALASVGAPWRVIQPSVEWLLRAQAANGGWNFPGTDAGHQRLIYTFYPTIVLARCRRRLGARADRALARVSAYLNSCDERDVAWWSPLREHLRRVVATPARVPRVASPSAFTPYWEHFEDEWPTTHVDEDWLPERFSMALMCGSNYLHLRRMVRPDDPLALLHIRYFADERIGSGWNDQREEQPKTWATALGALTLHRWARDLACARATLRRLPTRAELVARLRNGIQPLRTTSRTARSLVRRLAELRAGVTHATRYQYWLRDVFTFLYGEVLKEPKVESKTFFGTQRRDVTFRNAAEKGPWFDWKIRHETDSLLVECKNKDRLTYDDLRQTASYLGKRMGRVAILACRKNSGDDVWKMLNWFVNNDEKYLLIVNDENLIDWIRLKDRGEDPTDAIADLYRSLREGAQ